MPGSLRVTLSASLPGPTCVRPPAPAAGLCKESFKMGSRIPFPFLPILGFFCFLHKGSSRGSGTEVPVPAENQPGEAGTAPCCAAEARAALPPCGAGARGAGRRPAASITFWAPTINHSSLSLHGEWQPGEGRPVPAPSRLVCSLPAPLFRPLSAPSMGKECNRMAGSNAGK